MQAWPSRFGYPAQRAVFHGNRGQLRQRYLSGQEDQLGALRLVLNMIVLLHVVPMSYVIPEAVCTIGV